MDQIAQSAEASNLVAALRPFFAFGRLPAKSMHLFFLVAANQGETVGGLASRAGIPHSTASRLLMDLGPQNRRREAGLGLIEPHDNPKNLHETKYYLTTNGHKLMKSVVKNLGSK